MLQRRFAALLLLFAVTGCSDAGTRAAADIEAGVKGLGTQEGSRITISHTPRSWPSGCSAGYTFKVEKGSAIADGRGNFRTGTGSGDLTVRCDDGGGGSTTYHLRFVDVASTASIKRARGEPTLLDVERIGGRAVLVGIR